MDKEQLINILKLLPDSIIVKFNMDYQIYTSEDKSMTGSVVHSFRYENDE